MSGYLPIDCGLHDELQLRVLRKRPVDVVYDHGDGSQRVSSVLVDVYSRDGAEYLRLEDGTDIRLDHLREVDGLPFGGAGC